MLNQSQVRATLQIGNNDKGGSNDMGNLNITYGADEVIRTPDLLITNQLLYQLSYIGMILFSVPRHPNTSLSFFSTALCPTST